MARVTFPPPVANISGRLSCGSNIVLRTRNGKTQAYIIEHPYKGPVAPERQRTINAFKEAVSQSKTVLADPTQRAEWQKKYNKHKDYFRRHPSSSNKRYSTLRGFVIAQLTQQINAQTRQEQAAENQAVTVQTTATVQSIATTEVSNLTPTTKATVTSVDVERLLGDIGKLTT